MKSHSSYSSKNKQNNSAKMLPKISVHCVVLDARSKLGASSKLGIVWPRTCSGSLMLRDLMLVLARAQVFAAWSITTTNLLTIIHAPSSKAEATKLSSSNALKPLNSQSHKRSHAPKLSSPQALKLQSYIKLSSPKLSRTTSNILPVCCCWNSAVHFPLF